MRYILYNLGKGVNLKRSVKSFNKLNSAKSFTKKRYKRKPFSHGIFDIKQGRFV